MTTGFTVIEILVVILMVIAIFSMVLPIIGPMLSGAKLAEASSRISGTLRLARRLAIDENKIYNIRVVNGPEPYIAVYLLSSPYIPDWQNEGTFTEVPGSRVGLEQSIRFCPHLAGDPVGHPDSDLTATESLPRFGAEIRPDPRDGDYRPLYFLPDGSASVNCMIPIRDQDDRMAVVEVMGLTGQIILHKVGR